MFNYLLVNRNRWKHGSTYQLSFRINCSNGFFLIYVWMSGFFLELVRMKRVFRLLQFVVHYFHTLFNPVNKWEYSCVDFWIVCLALQMKIEFLILKEYRMILPPKKFYYRYAEWYDSHQFFLLWISHVDQWPTYLEMRTVVKHKFLWYEEPNSTFKSLI